jgi:Cu/Ag efflux pump CusA
VATVGVRPEPAAIAHDDVLRDVAVTAKVTGDPASAVAAVRSRIAALPMPYEYHAEVFGNAAVAQAGLVRVLGYAAAALIGIFLLLQAAVASWRRAGLLLLSLPLAVAGGVLTAPLAGGLWSIGSLARIIAVLALAIRHSVLFGYRIRAHEQGGQTARRGVLEVARDRSVPVLRSVLITAAILVPAAILGSQAGLEFLHPLAVTMLGGLVSLLLVQLFVLPALLLSTVGRAAPERHGPDQPEPHPGQPADWPGQPDLRPHAPEPRPATGAAPS